jgi:hypothetical protein
MFLQIASGRVRIEMIPVNRASFSLSPDKFSVDSISLHDWSKRRVVERTPAKATEPTI